MSTKTINIEIKLLKAVDKILCYGIMGKRLKKYADSWLEVPVDKKDAEDLQEFHDICRKLKS